MAQATAGRDCSILLIDLNTGRRIVSLNAACFYGPPRPIGSLIKPFTALAFLSEVDTPPRVACPPTEAGASQIEDCWYHPGHGVLGLQEALALSCNHYFFRLASVTPWDRFRHTLQAANLVETSSTVPLFADEEARLEFMMGRNGRMRVRPINLALAYAALFNGGKLFAAASEASETESLGTPLAGWNTRLVLEGMLASADHGTGRLAAVSPQRVYAKTGTTVSDLASPKGGVQLANLTEGWCISIVVDLQPAILIMTRINPGKGAGDAAPLAGEALRTYLRLTGNDTRKPVNTKKLNFDDFLASFPVIRDSSF
jgi:cell division protein FtsI/penicillin-binding protein 2